MVLVMKMRDFIQIKSESERRTRMGLGVPLLHPARAYPFDDEQPEPTSATQPVINLPTSCVNNSIVRPRPNLIIQPIYLIHDIPARHQVMTQPSVHELYERLETVGKGSYGSVHKGIHRATGNVVALKIIDLDADDGDDVDSIQREVALLTQLRDGPNITKYYSCHLDGPRVWIVMEFAQGGSVYSLMQSSPNNCLEEKYVVVIVREVLTGLNYLHKSNVIHRDIKAANVLVTASGKVMICDFGVSALLATTNSKRNTFIGTPYWMAPEVAQPVPAYDTKADIWSLGIMIYEMMKGSPPHFRIAHMKVIQMIPKVKPPRLAENEGSKDLRDFIPFTLTESPPDVRTSLICFDHFR
jgi:serine/threonine protein kinase